MKNIKVWKEISTQIGLQSEKGETILLSAFDFERNRLFFSSSEDVLYSISLSAPQSQVCVTKIGMNIFFYPSVLI